MFMYKYRSFPPASTSLTFINHMKWTSSSYSCILCFWWISRCRWRHFTICCWITLRESNVILKSKPTDWNILGRGFVSTNAMDTDTIGPGNVTDFRITISTKFCDIQFSYKNKTNLLYNLFLIKSFYCFCFCRNWKLMKWQ